MITLALLLLVVGFLYAVEHSWPGFRRIGAWWVRRGEPLKNRVRRAPLTYLYLVLLTFTTWLLANTSEPLRRAFLAEQSTNLHELRTNPVTVLVRSAMYVSFMELLIWWVAFSLVVAPMERRFGWQRMLAGFALGHVAATVAVACLQVWLFRAAALPVPAPVLVDVGASYGFCALAALATYQGSLRRRLTWAGAVVTVLGGLLLLDFDWTSMGHAVAALVGFASYRLVRPEAAVHHEARIRARHLYEMEHGGG
ncbi:rhomboid-like protein [Kocuria tytonis]|uniref:Rhomboid family intramembrane serine protease n=1 Tax=Kocuria tytonis TaxID=2054280 RepID=A0A495A2K8_9MICC|nr:rhomboid-like protein [Kocuria tytonis]RKQ33757.1 hypothetical protein C1C97_011185 [Kocuria tytonis]